MGADKVGQPDEGVGKEVQVFEIEQRTDADDHSSVDNDLRFTLILGLDGCVDAFTEHPEDGGQYYEQDGHLHIDLWIEPIGWHQNNYVL